MSEIKIQHAKKVYNNTTEVISDLNVTIKDGELFCLLGPSGCGKTTLLRMIAGFNSIEAGDFFFGDRRINDMDPAKRNIGMVFQNYAVFPHLSVRDNVAFGLKQKKGKDKLTKEEITQRTDKYLKLMQIDAFADRKPDALSGGQQQRVALARALVMNPDVLLMDEPLSNLDAKLRVDMREVIRDIQHRVGITTVYVTHDQEEAMAIADHIAVMYKGEIQQVGAPKELYHRPANEFVANFIGRTNMLDAKLKDKQGHAYIELESYSFAVPQLDGQKTQDVRLSCRPEDLMIVQDGEQGFSAQIKDSVYLGATTEYFVHADFCHKPLQVCTESSMDDSYTQGQDMYLAIKQDKINVFDASGSHNLMMEA